MKFGTVLLTIFFAACALGLLVWVASHQPPEVRSTNDSETAEQIEVNLDGPQPRAEVEETVHNFGVSAVGRESHHIFIVKNAGEAPLNLAKGPSSCQCTVGSFDKSEVAPGEIVEVKLAWTPKEPTSNFHHHAIVKTNDPKNREIHFEVMGEAYVAVREMPEGTWMLPDLLEKQTTEFTGYVSSPILEDFQIKEIKCSTPLLSAKPTRLDKAGLEKLLAKSGYRIDVEVSPEVPLGPFNESITVVTDAEEGITLTVGVRSQRAGPLKIVRLEGGAWDQQRRMFSLNSFSSAQGHAATFLVYVNDLKDKELEFSEMVIDPKFLKVSLKPDPSFQSKKSKRYLLTLEVPPGSPSATYLPQNPAQVHLKTNLPDLPELNFGVKFVSR